jgi:Asp/Glu/hydantoin racemase
MHDAPVTTIGFLHTSPVHIPVFRALLAELDPDVADVQLVDESLLADVRERGYDASIEARLLDRLHELAGHDPAVIVCTCSTLSGHAERLDGQVGAPVLRIDRPLAERAVAHGGRVALVAAVESTLGPTRALFEECASATRSGAAVVDAPCLEAWPLFERGDLAGFHEHIARHVRALAADADVVVLAQASMAPAAALLADVTIPVLSSPRLAVLRALEIATAHRPTRP